MWSDYDAEARTLHVSRSLTLKDQKVVANPPKWNSVRVLPLTGEAVQIIEQIPQCGLYLFPNAKSAPHSPYSWSQKLRRFMSELHAAHPEIPKLTAHELRHTYGTYLRRHGIEINTIQKLLGHKDITVTTEIYVHNELSQLRQAVNEAFPIPKDAAK